MPYEFRQKHLDYSFVSLLKDPFSSGTSISYGLILQSYWSPRQIPHTADALLKLHFSQLLYRGLSVLITALPAHHLGFSQPHLSLCSHLEAETSLSRMGGTAISLQTSPHSHSPTLMFLKFKMRGLKPLWSSRRKHNRIKPRECWVKDQFQRSKG